MAPISNDSSSTPTTSEEGPRFQEALEGQRAALMAMAEEQIERRPRLDPTVAFLAAWATVGRVQAHLPALVTRFGQDAKRFVDELPLIALATRQADIDWKKANEGTDSSALHDEVGREHRLLLTDAESLVNRGLLPEKSLNNARGLQGYQTTVDSLQVVISVLREHWSAIEGHTPITRADLDRAEMVAMRMTSALSKRGQATASIGATDLRARALSKLVRTYEEVRRMVVFLRWFEGDAAMITPSLYAGRGGRPSGREDEPDDVVTDPVDTDKEDMDTEVVPPPPVTPSPDDGPPFTS